MADEVCQAIDALAEYDFDSEVSVTVLGHIFEQSIADLEALNQQISEGELPAPAKPKAVTGRRKRQGVVYTPDHITAFIVEHTLGAHIASCFERLLADYGQFRRDGSIQWKRGSKTELRFWYAWQEALQGIKVVDPACGSGAFLVAAFDWLHAEYQRVNDKLAELTGQHSVLDLNKTILNDNLYGVDINSESIEISKLSLWLKTAEKGKSLTSLDDNLIAGNSLGFDEPAPGARFTWQAAFPNIMAQGGFDVVLGNPPYVRMELLKEIKPWLEDHYEVVSDRADLYCYFYELGLKLLRPRGRLGYISSSTFFKTRSGEPLRCYLLNNSALEKAVDFGDLQVFEGVTTYPAILVLKKSASASDRHLDILQLRDALPENLSQHFAQHHGRMAQGQLGRNSWQLEDERLHALRKKLTQGHPTLKDVYGSPLYGVKTGLMNAFVINNATREQLLIQDPASTDLLKPYLGGKDLKKWYTEPRGLWLIYIPKNQVNIDDYPAIKSWLLPFKDRLENRATKQEWYELQQAQFAYALKFEKPKIFYPDLSSTPRFALDTKGYFSETTLFFIPHSDEYLLGLLNSKPTWFLITAICPMIRGGYYRAKSIYIETLPVPKTSEKQKEKLAALAKHCQSLAETRYKIQQDFRRRIPDLCPPDRQAKLNNKLKAWWELNFDAFQKEIKKAFKAVIPLAERNDWQDYLEKEQAQIAELSRQLAEQEVALNQVVYDLFGLTAEEISLLESNL